MNTLAKSLTAFVLLTGAVLPLAPARAERLPAPVPALTALTSLLAEPASPLPSGTRLLSVRVVDGLATVNFSHELRDNFTGGDSAETRTINALLRTLGQFPSVSRMQLLVEGQSVDSLGGLLMLTDPLPVLRPAEGPGAERHLHRKPVSAIRPGKGA